MKKKLMMGAVALAMAAQSTPTFADRPGSWGLCEYIQQWTSGWLPCFPSTPGQRVGW